MSYVVGRVPNVLNAVVGEDVPDAIREGASARTLLRTRGLRALMMDVVAAECGVSPRRSHRDSIAWKAYRTGVALLTQELSDWEIVAKPGEPVPDIRAFAFVAANRGCWSVLEGSEAHRAQLRSQIRCIFALTPGFALWNTNAQPSVQAGGSRRLPEWVVGQAEWRDAGQPVRPISLPVALLPAALLSATPKFGNASPFDAVRISALAIVERHSAPLTVEALVDVLVDVEDDSDYSKTHEIGQKHPKRAVGDSK